MPTRLNTEMINDAFSGLANTLMRKRLANDENARYQQERGDRLAHEGVEAAFRQQELENQRKANVGETNYRAQLLHIREMQERAQAQKMQAAGVEKVKSSWVTASGQKMEIEGTPEQVRQATQANPPAPSEKITTEFITKDGVKHTITGTTEQLQKQQEALAAAGGGIQPQGEPKPPGTTIDWPIGPPNSQGTPAGRIRGPVSDPSVRAMMGTNAPPLAPAQEIAKPKPDKDPLGLFSQQP